jgi:gliding motility-associated-like protein
VSLFSNQSSVQNGGFTQYEWTFGDGGVSSEFNPSHLYTAPGNYTVSLRVTSGQGCSSVITKQASVKPLPVPSFTGGGSSCSSLRANFTDLSTAGTSGISGWQWNFGDGSTSTVQHPVHTYTNPGFYTVSLIVRSNDGCSATVMQPGAVLVYPSPIADFRVDRTGTTKNNNKVVKFENLSADYISLTWNMGDGTVLYDVQEPVHRFAEYGKYEVQLIAYSSNGCVDTIIRVLEIKSESTLYVPNAFTPNGDGRNDMFLPYHTEIKDIEVMIFDRWGTLVTSWNGLTNSWDGTFKGQPAPADVYVYKIRATGTDDKDYDLTGQVAIIR